MKVQCPLTGHSLLLTGSKGRNGCSRYAWSHGSTRTKRWAGQRDLRQYWPYRKLRYPYGPTWPTRPTRPTRTHRELLHGYSCLLIVWHRVATLVGKKSNVLARASCLTLKACLHYFPRGKAHVASLFRDVNKWIEVILKGYWCMHHCGWIQFAFSACWYPSNSTRSLICMF